MNETVKLAKAHNVAVGAHPGLPDLKGFGRRNIFKSGKPGCAPTATLCALASFTVSFITFSSPA
jgi:lactam utilization protein B